MGPTLNVSLACAAVHLGAISRLPYGLPSHARPKACLDRTHRGGCDCGAVRYELELDATPSVLPPTVSGLTVRARSFKLLSGEGSLSGHELVSSQVHHFYCELCGVCSFERHNVEQQSSAFYAVDLRCLDVPRSVWE